MQHAFSVFNASAGSGKTFTLVKKYLAIVLQSPRDDAYKNILAITFTNKAVQEMKKRVLDNLAAFSAEVLPEKANDMLQALQEETKLSEAQIRAKSRKIMKNLIHNYASFDITTIDKFTHRVIRAFANDLNLPPTFEVSLDTDALLTETIDRIIAMAGENEELTNLLVDFSLSKTDDDKSWDVTQDFLAIGRMLMNENNQREVQALQDKTVADFLAVRDTIAQQITQNTEAVYKLGQEAFSAIENIGLTKKSFNRGIVFNFFEKIAAGNLPNPSKVLDYLEEGNRYAKGNPQAEKNVVDGLAPQLIIWAESIQKKASEVFLHQAFLTNMTPLSLLNRMSQTLKEIQEEQNMLSITAFNAIIRNEIQNQPAPFIYEKMGERYQHFFIDEFQDTSEMQWQNLIPLIDNSLVSESNSGERGSLLIVGDPKQSIYRWRGGKAEQFIALSGDENPFMNPSKDVQNLDTNFRSSAEIVTFNNDFFGFTAHNFQNEAYRNLYENNSFQYAKSKEGGYVSMTFIQKEQTKEETQILYLEQILTTIEQLLQQGYSYSDIAILTRKRDSGIMTAQFLMEHDIPLLSSETLLISSASEVQLLIEILKYLLNSKDKEAKVLMLTYLSKRLLEDENEHHDFIQKGMLLDDETAFETWLEGFDIAISFQNLRKKSLYETVEYCVTHFLKLKNSNAFVQYFLDLVLEKTAKTLASLSDFLQFWETNQHKLSIPLPEGNNAVRILTIHKAKGLEFPVVIFPFAEEIYSKTPKSPIWLETASDDLGLPKFLINESAAMENFGDTASEKYQQLREEHLLDNLNVLYVALTRPVEQLFIISEMNLNKDNQPLTNTMSAFFIDFLMQKGLFNPAQMDYSFGISARISQKESVVSNVKTIELLPNLLPPDAIKIAQKETLMWGSSQQDAINFGNLIHEIMANIETEADISLALQKAEESGLITQNQYEVFEQKLKAIIQHESLQMFFATDNQVKNEQMILRNSGHFIKPDRIVQRNTNEILLLDYKTGKPTKSHEKQINNYADVLTEMGFEVAKKTLVYLDEMNIEVVEVV
uniref:UvrD-helicase domain-containing protein n=1 Tax=Flavobacterium sp. TaxID=239 RepID=UPI004048EF63